MDPVTALGVAASAVQFLDFAIEVLSTCKEIRDDFQGATKANRELDVHSRELKAISKELENETRSATKAGKRIAKIANDCLTSAEEIQALLTYIRKAGNSKLTSVAITAFRTMKERKTIEKLQNALKDRRALLDSAMIQDIRSNRVDLAEIQQRKDFDTLTKSIRDLINQLLAQEVANKEQLRRTDKTLSSIFQQNANQAASSAINHRTTHSKIDVLQLEMEAQLSRLQIKEDKEALLSSLFYPEHSFRGDSIRPPFERTFEWMFECDRPPVEKDEDAEHDSNEAPEEDDSVRKQDCKDKKQTLAPAGLGWPRFTDWLESSDSLYWITGKPGSGKSTLMTFIVHDPRTKENLEKWALSKRVHTFSFFFWRPADRSPLQKSIEGLLRSLIYQLLDEVDGLCERYLEKHHLTHTRITTWTERGLCEMLKAIMSLAADSRFCFLIDGLDEFDGDYNTLLDTIFELKRLSHVKTCVASRPEPVMAQRLSGFAQLKMENLNRNDIELFVHTTLSSRNLATYFVDIITYNAEGVFLWAVLATQSVVRGVQSGDDEETLERRIVELPKELSALFFHMLSSVDPVHRNSLGRLLRAKELDANLSVTTLAACFLGAPDIDTYVDFWEKCAKVVNQIEWQSHGILYVTEIDRIGSTLFHKPGCQIWMLPSHRKISGLLPDLASTIAARESITDIDTVRTLSIWHRKLVSWTHRSAFDFVFGDGQNHAENLVNIPSKSAVTDEIIQAYFKLWSIWPYHSCSSKPERLDILRALMVFLGRNASTSAASISAHVTRLESLVLQLNTDEIESSPHYHHQHSRIWPECANHSVLLPELFFWHLIADTMMLDSFPDQLLDQITTRHHANQVLAVMINTSLVCPADSWTILFDPSRWLLIHRMMSLFWQLLVRKADGSSRVVHHHNWHDVLESGKASIDWESFECDDLDQETQAWMLQNLIKTLGLVVIISCLLQIPESAPKEGTDISGIANTLDQILDIWQTDVHFILDDIENLNGHRVTIILEAHFGHSLGFITHPETFGPLGMREPVIWLEVRYEKLAPAEEDAKQLEKEDCDPLVQVRLQLAANSNSKRIRVRHDYEFGIGGNVFFAVELYDALLEECWDNNAGMLDSWQQLCAVACLRMMRRRREDIHFPTDRYIAHRE